MPDTRIVNGARCAWWDSIDKVAKGGTSGTLPVCPFCGGVLFETESETTWWADVDRYEANHPGYRGFIEWLRGRHYRTFEIAQVAYDRGDNSQPLPCGCVLDTQVIDGQNVFIVVPHALDCRHYRYIVEEAESRGKPVQIVDAR